MVDHFKSLVIGQYEASLRTLKDCIDQCPDEAWDAPVCNHAYCQAVFHTLFFADLYLGRSVEAQREQAFHKQRPEFFRTYEEMIDRKPELLYDRATVLSYLEFCRDKAREVVSKETEATLAGPTGFDWHTISRAELHVYNIRHIQHHAAQLGLRLRLDFATDIAWQKSGW